MARLPSELFLIQQIGGEVILFEDGTEREIVRFDPGDANAAARAQKVIHDDPTLDEQDKAFAHFWSGYFYGCANGDTSPEAAEDEGKISLSDLGFEPPYTADITSEPPGVSYISEWSREGGLVLKGLPSCTVHTVQLRDVHGKPIGPPYEVHKVVMPGSDLHLGALQFS
jgi:hypothetical protein